MSMNVLKVAILPLGGDGDEGYRKAVCLTNLLEEVSGPEKLGFRVEKMSFPTRDEAERWGADLVIDLALVQHHFGKIVERLFEELDRLDRPEYVRRIGEAIRRSFVKTREYNYATPDMPRVVSWEEFTAVLADYANPI